MTLDEHVETEKRIAKEFLDESQSTRAGAVVSHMYEELYYAHMERADLLEQLKTLRKAFELACKAIQEETEPNYCDVLSYGPCRKGNAVGKVWDDNKCAECCMECFLTQAQESEGNNENKA